MEVYSRVFLYTDSQRVVALYHCICNFYEWQLFDWGTTTALPGNGRARAYALVRALSAYGHVYARATEYRSDTGSTTVDLYHLHDGKVLHTDCLAGIAGLEARKGLSGAEYAELSLVPTTAPPAGHCVLESGHCAGGLGDTYTQHDYSAPEHAEAVLAALASFAVHYVTRWTPAAELPELSPESVGAFLRGIAARRKAAGFALWDPLADACRRDATA